MVGPDLSVRILKLTSKEKRRNALRMVWDPIIVALLASLASVIIAEARNRCRSRSVESEIIVGACNVRRKIILSLSLELETSRAASESEKVDYFVQ